MRYRQHKCKCCHKWFDPEPHNAWHQRYCNGAECRAVSHRASHWRWLRHNRDAHTGTANVTRVRAWRAKHPARSEFRVERHFHLDIRVPTCPPKPGIAVRIAERKHGTLRDFTLPQPVHSKRIRQFSMEALREVVQSGFRNWYQGRHRNERAPP